MSMDKPFLLSFAIEAINEGKGIGGELLLRHLVDAKKEGRPASEEVLDIVYLAFEKILSGDESAKALNLSYKPGNPPESVSSRDARQSEIFDLVEAYIVEGEGQPVAFENVAIDLGCSESKINKAYYSEKKRRPYSEGGPEVKKLTIEEGLPYYAEQDRVPLSVLEKIYDYAVRTGRLSRRSPKEGSALLKALGRKQRR